MTSVRANGEVEFRFFRAGAREVCVAGDFTDWQDNAVAMRHDGNGWWSVKMCLAAGEYRFRYVADGQWFTDFASQGVELKQQEWNSILVVPETAETETETQTETQTPAPVRSARRGKPRPIAA